MGSKVSIDNANGDSIDLEANTNTALATPIASKAQPGVLSLDTSEVWDVLDKSEEAEDDSNKADGPDLDVPQWC